MKKTTFILLAAASLLGACQANGQKTVLTGTLTGVESDTLLVMNAPLSRDGMPLRDTVPMTGGQFRYEVEQDTEPREIYIYAKPAGNKAFSMKNITVMAFPGDKLKLTGSVDDCRIEGSDFYAEYNEATPAWADQEERLIGLSLQAQEMANAGMPIDSIARSSFATAQSLLDSVVNAKKTYIAAHPDSEVSLYLLASAAMIGTGNVEELMPKLTDRVKTGRLSSLYTMLEEEVKAMQAQKAASGSVAEGAQAPDFTLKDMDGKDLSLSSLRGKYVVLDFWGSWCGWCIKGFPDMKKYYAKYKDRMEILGIDCGDTEEKWKAAVKKHALPWLHVRNEGGPDVTALYAVDGYPTKIVVDPEGKIVKVVRGEDPAFYEYLDELFK